MFAFRRRLLSPLIRRPLRHMTTISRVPPEKIRNVAIIAHVDHGKTTLVDGLLSNSGQNVVMNERMMDSNSLEKERGITIMSKCTSIDWNGHLVNIVDTPGHSDFGGEVERVLSMVDGVCLVVDATDGPMTQTKFVLGKALKHGLRPIVVINKVDRPTARVDEVEMDLYELFENLGADEKQLEYPTVYACARDGWAVRSMGDEKQNLHVLLDMIVGHIPPPPVDPNGPFCLLVNQLDHHHFLGRCLLGRIHSGTLKAGDTIKALDQNGDVIEEGKVLKLFTRRGIDQVEVEEASAGQIISVAGFPLSSVSATLCNEAIKEPLPSTPIDPPTVSVTISANTSPIMGEDGKYLTPDDIKERIRKECELSVALRYEEAPNNPDAVVLKGRGELQLGIVMENMRREGFEISVSPPQVINIEKDGKSMEPVEEVFLEVDNNHAGTVIEKMTKRLGTMVSYEPASGDPDRSRIVFHIPARGLLGFRSEFVNDTRGTGVLSTIFHEYAPVTSQKIERSSKGALIAMAAGVTTRYALNLVEPRGQLFIGEGTKVYPGMVIGEHSRDNDLEVNCVKAKEVTNMRASGKDEAIRLSAPRAMTLEDYLAYCREDEMIEVTPAHIRLRKALLDPNDRKRAKTGKK